MIVPARLSGTLVAPARKRAFPDRARTYRDLARDAKGPKSWQNQRQTGPEERHGFAL
jgi:hypothetical protein